MKRVILFAVCGCWILSCDKRVIEIPVMGQAPYQECISTVNPDAVSIRPNPFHTGWELYSWPGCGDWNFSFFYGTNSEKNYEIVTGREALYLPLMRIWSIRKMKLVLSGFPAGESVVFRGPQFLSQIWVNHSSGDLDLPPSSILHEFSGIARANGFSLTILP